MIELGRPLSLKHGRDLKNRFMLAPMTNQQSHADGVLSDNELHWLTKRAEGGFGLTMTCATNVQADGKSWPGQLGAFDDGHIEGLSRLAKGIQQHGSHASVQLFHGGRRAEPDLIEGAPRAPSDDPETGARAMGLREVEQLRDSFIAAALRCDRAGFDSVEIHAAHGFAVCQFLSPEFNRREDVYGGSAKNRARLLMEILDGIRAACRPDFGVGVRLSPEHHGLDFGEMRDLTQRLIDGGQVDYIDMSMHDAFKEPEDKAFSGKTLSEWYLALPRGDVRMGVGGKIHTPEDILKVSRLMPDFVVLGRSGILHHDFPRLALNNAGFCPRTLPVTRETLLEEGLSDTFVTYLASFEGFVSQPVAS